MNKITTRSARARLRHGFTLVELVIVIAVIAVLAAVLVPTFISVIDNANNSADVQLAANLNTALADAQVYPDEVASAQNIRKHVRDFGYEPADLVTKRSNNVIAYNKNSNRMEVLDVSKVTSEQLTSSYYAEEVISGYIIVSTGGNDLAEALYSLCNLPAESAAGATISRMSGAVNPVADTVETSISTHVTNALNKIPYSDIRSMVMNVVQATLFVNPDGKIYTIGVSDDGTISATKIDSVPTYDLSDMGSWELPIRSRVAFSETLEEFDIKPLLQARTALTVVVPNTVTLTNTSGITDYSDLPAFSGNVGSAVPSEKVVTVDTAKEIAGEAIVDDIAEAYEQATSTLYNVNQVYTSDFKNNFDSTLEIAKKVYEIKTQKAEGKAVDPIRLVVNGHSTIAGAVTIPDYVDVQIPFALGNVNAKAIMEYELGDALGGKPLGSAYPANDNGNLSEDNYYLCGEGPGGGKDFQLSVTTNEAALAIFKATNNISTAKANYSLTVSSGATLYVEGKLTIGAVIGYPDASGYQGHTSGAYGYITNNGKISVNKGGVLDAYGFIEGSGEVVANEGGLVFEPFVVADYLDTVATLWAYPFVGLDADIDTSTVDFNFPFMRYTVMNIKTDITMNHGSALYGRANLMVFGGFLYCRTTVPLITSDNYVYDTYKNQYKTVGELQKEGYTQNADGSFTMGEGEDAQTIYANGAFVLSTGSSIMSTYSNNCIKITDSSKCEDYEKEDIANKNSFAGDIGVNNITIKGNVSTGSISLNLLGGAKNVQGGNAMVTVLTNLNPKPVTTTNCIFPVPYHFNFTVEPDSTLTLNENNKYALLPGSGITIKSGANLIIKNNAALYALDTYATSEMFRQSSDTLLKYFNNYFTVGLVQTSQSLDSTTGIFSLGKFIMEQIKLSLARKYYPSATLLKANGFSTSANLTVNGTITVEKDGDLGGTVTAGDSATIKLANGAGMGKVINLGGTYAETSMFYSAAHPTQNIQESGDTVGSSLKFINTVYVPCYLSVVNTKGKAISFDKETQYAESTQDKTYAKKTTDNVTCTTDLITIATQDTELTIKLPYRKAKTDINIDSQMLNSAAGTPVQNSNVAYFSYDSISGLTLKDNSSAT